MHSVAYVLQCVLVLCLPDQGSRFTTQLPTPSISNVSHTLKCVCYVACVFSFVYTRPGRCTDITAQLNACVFNRSNIFPTGRCVRCVLYMPHNI